MATDAPSPEEEGPSPENIATAVLVQVAGIVIKATKDTADPRLVKLQNHLLATLKEGDVLETLLVAVAEQAKPQEDLSLLSQMSPVNALLQARARTLSR